MEITTPVKERLVELKKQIKNQPYLFPHLADCYLMIGKPRQAAKTLLKGLEKFPDNPMGWLIKGNLHVKLNQPKQAMTAFKQVLKLDNNVSYAHEKCADLSMNEGNSEWYIYHLQELNRLEPLDDEVRREMDIEIMKRIAVEKAVFSRKDIEDVKPEILRKTIIDRNLLPKNMKRKTTRRGSDVLKPKDEKDSFDPFADIMQPPEPEKVEEPEVNFLKEDNDDSEEKPNLASDVLKTKGSDITAKMKTDTKSGEESIKKHEDAKDRIAEIARSVTHPPIKRSDKSDEEDEEQTAAEDEIEEQTLEKEDKEDDHSDINDPVEDALPDKEEQSDDKPAGRVATKTLAELYFSQGNIKSSVEVYEELIELHPENEEFSERLQVLKVKLEEESETSKGNNAEEN